MPYVLIIIFILVLLLPLLVRKVEHNLELILLVFGSVTLMLSRLLGTEPLLSLRLIKALLESTGSSTVRV
jgi:predicted cation transporter